MNVNVDMLFGHGSGFLNSAFVAELGKDADYISVWETWSVELADKKPLIAKVNDLYRARYGRNLNSLTAAAFTTSLTVADAINRAGSTDPEKIREALRATDIPSEQTIMPWEKIAFDPETGQNNHATGIICQIQNGKYRVIWPNNLASAKPVWPMPKWSDR
jgi:branched-chain amino acid transport system substrate-binding protein